MNNIKSLTLNELENEMLKLGEPKYRAGQVFDWLHKRGARSFDEMSNLSKALRQKLAGEYVLPVLTIDTVQVSKLDGTRKYLLSCEDENRIEAVLMRYEYGLSLCISSQVGCRMGCAFCASGIDGLVRNLTPAEMLDEVYVIENDVQERISHIVVMGTGEPLDNFHNLVRFLTLITDEKGRNLSARNITVSTCGLAPKIRDLADVQIPVTLALSLHASTDEKRKRIMPVAKSYALKEIFEACAYYFEKTGRRVSFEYALIAGVNDTEEDLRELTQIAKKNHAHINLIPVNPVAEKDTKRPEKKAVLSFRDKLTKNGVNVTLRRELGTDIDGACGQLRRRYSGKEGIPKDPDGTEDDGRNVAKNALM